MTPFLKIVSLDPQLFAMGSKDSDLTDVMPHVQPHVMPRRHLTPRKVKIISSSILDMRSSGDPGGKARKIQSLKDLVRER